METLDGGEEEPGETFTFNPEQVALQGLVDRIIDRADRASFWAMNGILDAIRRENETPIG